MAQFWRFFFLLAAGCGPLLGQVQVAVEVDRASHLLFEPVNVKVSILNNTENDLTLRGTDLSPWLSFLVTRADGTPVRSEQPLAAEPVVLKSQQARAILVNVTPLFAFRDPGDYRIRAVVNLPGSGDIISSTVTFSVANGHKIWSQTRPINASERIYSLVRFVPSVDTTYLYIRVEDEKENIVYATFSIGEIVAFSEPQTAFDLAGNLHIIHVDGKSSYCYSVIGVNGNMKEQAHYISVNDDVPRLRREAEGAVLVAGGRKQGPETQRERLSETQPAGHPQPAAAAPAKP
jgi:hypothetical protein